MRKILLLSCAVLFLCASCTKTEKTYYPDGHVQSSIQYRFGKENGKTIYYYDNPNTVEIEVEMKNGKRHGEFNRYYQNGYLDTHCQYVNDSIEGVETNYTANGEKAQEFTYVRGVKNGPHKAYHLSGELKIEGGFKDDKFDGDWKYYDDRGVLVGEGSLTRVLARWSSTTNADCPNARPAMWTTRKTERRSTTTLPAMCTRRLSSSKTELFPKTPTPPR